MAKTKKTAAPAKQTQSEVKSNKKKAANRHLTEADLKYIQGVKLPAPVAHVPPKTVVGAFADEAVLTALRNPEVAAYFGKRLNVKAALAATADSSASTDISARLEHAKQLMDRVSAGANSTLVLTAGVMARDWDEFAAESPTLADALEPILEWWNANYPGRNAAQVAEATTQAKDASKDASTPKK
jgi:hypothetical protein